MSIFITTYCMYSNKKQNYNNEQKIQRIFNSDEMIEDIYFSDEKKEYSFILEADGELCQANYQEPDEVQVTLLTSEWMALLVNTAGDFAQNYSDKEYLKNLCLKFSQGALLVVIKEYGIDFVSNALSTQIGIPIFLIKSLINLCINSKVDITFARRIKITVPVSAIQSSATSCVNYIKEQIQKYNNQNISDQKIQASFVESFLDEDFDFIDKKGQVYNYVTYKEMQESNIDNLEEYKALQAFKIKYNEPMLILKQNDFNCNQSSNNEDQKIQQQNVKIQQQKK